MQPIFALALYASAFLAIIFLVNAVTRFVRIARGLDDETVDRRLLREVSVSETGPTGLSLLRGRVAGEQPWLRFIPFLPNLLRLMQVSGTDAGLGTVLGFMAGLGLLIFFILFLIVPAFLIPISMVGAALGGIGLVVMYLSSAKKRRLAKFEQGLPDAIDLITRSLKIGHPISGAMAVVARELPEPISSEFAASFDQITYGQDVATAFNEMARRVPVQDLGYLAMAIQIQQEAGGNLVESLSQLSTVIRDRFRMFRKVKALTAEGRFSAWFLSAFPFVMVFAVQLIRPDYYTQVMDMPIFWPLVGVTFLLLCVNVIAMRVITTIKV